MASPQTKTQPAPSTMTRQWPSLLLIKLGRISLYRYTAALESLGVKPRHVATLIEDRGALTQGALGEQLCLDPTNVVAILNDLEHEGLAERTRDPEDRRRHIVEATAKAKATLAKAEKAMDAVEDELFEDLSDDERAEIESLLSRVWQGAGGMDAYTEAADADPDPVEIPKT
jgi:DNA-binding MarR family transcriptional regulator